MTDDILRKAHTGEAGNSGEFGTHTRPESGVTLALPGSVEVGPYVINTVNTPALPEWPTSLGERDISWNYDDVSGDPAVTVKVGDHWVSSYGSDGDIYTTIDGDGDDDWTDEEREVIESTLRVADERARIIVAQAEQQAIFEPGIHDGLTAVIAEKPATAVAPVALAPSARHELETALAKLDAATAKFAEDTDNGDDASDEDYDTLRDAKYDFAENTEALLRRLLAR